MENDDDWNVPLQSSFTMHTYYLQTPNYDMDYCTGIGAVVPLRCVVWRYIPYAAAASSSSFVRVESHQSELILSLINQYPLKER